MDIRIKADKKVQSYKEYVEILKEELDYYQKVKNNEIPVNSPMEMITAKKKCWEINIEIEAKENFIKEYTDRQNLTKGGPSL